MYAKDPRKSVQFSGKQQVHIPQEFTGQRLTAGSNDKDASEEKILREPTIPPPWLHDVPPEILSEIFILAIPTRKFETDAGSPVEDKSDYRVKFALSQVCRYWREVALATPQIWSSIPVVHEDRLESNGFMAFTKMFIERSSSTPLHITIILPESLPRIRKGKKWKLWRSDTTPSLLNLICSHAYRWKSAILHLHDNNAKIFRVLEFPILESLNFKCTSLIFLQFFIDLRTNWHTPSLHHVILHGLKSQLDFPQGHPYTSELEAIEPAGPQLRRCVLTGPLCLQWYPSTLMVFSQLTSLKVINIHCTYERLIIPEGETLLRCISTPVLENLEIRSTSNLNDASLTVTELRLSVLFTPSITLRSILFHVIGMTEEDLKKLLCSTPCLTTLDICNTPASVFACLDVGAAKTLSGFKKPLTPRLQSLTIHDFSHLDAAALWAVYDSRHPPLNTIEDNMKVARLDIILSYRSFRACRYAQCRCIAEVGGVNIKALKKILGWCDHLVKQFLVEFPEKEKKYAVPGNKKSFRHMYSPKELDVFFTDVIEAHQFRDPIIIELSRITRILSDIRDLPPTAILDDNDYEFRKRAGRVLDSLAPLLEDLTSRRRWILGKDHLTLRACGPTTICSREN